MCSIKNNMAYEYSFASVYDAFTQSVDYESRADYICNELKKHGITDGIILDTACGTGTLSELFIKKGFEVIANDISPEMLSIAGEKLRKYDDKAILLCQDMCELDLYGTVDAAVCSLDSINHLLDEDDVIAAFDSIGMFIRPDGIFVFDVNSQYKHRSVLSGQSFVYEDDASFLVWQNTECDDDDIVAMYIDIFSQDSDGRYLRMSDYIEERAYSVEFISSALQQSGFDILGIFGDMTSSYPEDNEERIYFFAKKI